MTQNIARGSADGPRKIFGRENVNWSGPKRAQENTTVTSNASSDIATIDDRVDQAYATIDDMGAWEYPDSVNVKENKIYGKDEFKPTVQLLGSHGKVVESFTLDSYLDMDQDYYDDHVEKISDYLAYHDVQTKEDARQAKEDKKIIKEFKANNEPQHHPKRGFNRVLDTDATYGDKQTLLATVDVANKVFSDHIGDVVREDVGLTDEVMHAAMLGAVSDRQGATFTKHDHVDIHQGKVFYNPQNMDLNQLIHDSFWSASAASIGVDRDDVGASAYQQEMNEAKSAIRNGDIYTKASYLKRYGEDIIDRGKDVAATNGWRTMCKDSGGRISQEAIQTRFSAVRGSDALYREVQGLKESGALNDVVYTADGNQKRGEITLATIAMHQDADEKVLEYAVKNRLFSRNGGWTDEQYDVIRNSDGATDKVRNMVDEYQKRYQNVDTQATVEVEQDIHAANVLDANPKYRDALAAVGENKGRGMERTMQFDPAVVNAVGEEYVMRHYVKLQDIRYDANTGVARGYVD